jgi:hypothetical protein
MWLSIGPCLHSCIAGFLVLSISPPAICFWSTMKDAILLVVGALVGAAVGLIFGARYEDGLKAWFLRRKQLNRSRAIQKAVIDADGPLSIGGHATDFYLVEGNGETVLEPAYLSIAVRSTSVELPNTILNQRKRIAEELKSIRRGKAGSIASWNSQNMLTLNRYYVTRTADREDIKLHLETTVSDYATFAATVLGLDNDVEVSAADGSSVKTTLRHQYFPNAAAKLKAVRSPIPSLANGIGVALLAFTTDGRVVLTRRRDNSRARPGERDVSVVEGMDALQDVPQSGRLDAYCTAVRGCQEELGVPVNAEVVQFLAFGVDLKFYQWSLLGMVNLPFSADEVMNHYQINAKDRWEGKLEAVVADPKRVFETFRDDSVWDLGLVAAYLAFCKKMDVVKVRRAAEEVFGKPSATPPPWRRS